jgi:predicted aspartyl protease
MADITKPIVETEAYKILKEAFDASGAPQLGIDLADLVVGDPTLMDRTSELVLEIRKKPSYIQRFSGLVKLREYNNTAEGKVNPVAVMDEGEYLRQENIYKEVLSPISNLYGKNINKTIGDLIGSQVSSVELQSRVTTAQAWANNADPAIKQTLKDFYNVTDEDLVAYALDPKTATSMLEKQAGVTTLASEAAQTNVKINQDYTEKMLQRLVDTGAAKDLVQAGQIAAKELGDITVGTATGYNPSAGTLTGLTQLGKIEGRNLTGEQILGASLGTDVTAAEEVRGLKSRERARFEQGQGGTNVLQQNVSGTV